MPSIKHFAGTYKMDCLVAINHLVVSRVLGTVEHCAAVSSTSTSAAIVAVCVQNFITSMDSFHLNMVDVDQAHPLLSDLNASLNKLSILPLDFEGKTKMKEWIARLSKMGAADELTEQQARRLHFDLETLYGSSPHCWYMIEWGMLVNKLKFPFSPVVLLFLVYYSVDWRGIGYLVTAYLKAEYYYNMASFL